MGWYRWREGASLLHALNSVYALCFRNSLAGLHIWFLGFGDDARGVAGMAGRPPIYGKGDAGDTQEPVSLHLG